MPRPDLIDTERISATIEAEAEKQRREDDTFGQFERDIEQTWADITPSGEVDESRGDLLDQTASLAALDPQVPIGSRRGLRGVKWLVRKLTYWYIRFLTDQFNVFSGVLIRHLRSLETRLGNLEAATAQPVDQAESTASDCLDDPPEPSPAVASLVADFAGVGPCLVLSGGEGAILKAMGDRGIRARGVEQDPDRVLAGLRSRVDIRSGDATSYLADVGNEGFSTIVLTGFVEKLALTDLLGVIDQAGHKLMKTGRIIVAVADPANRSRVELELGSGLGISPITWRHLLERAGFDASLEPCSDSRITEIVVAHRSESRPDNSN
ncbi:MAG: hypothetical protein F4153_07155 [Acidimicrobiia bacterium]|nr:hypothetical protein [Acidimicrobiia bacterium]